MFSFGTKRVVGLEIDDCEIRAVELEKKGDIVNLINWGRKNLSPGLVKDGIIVQADKVGEELSELWLEKKFKSKDVVTGVSNQGVLVRFANFPKMPQNKLHNFIRYQSQDYLPVSLDTIVFDYSIIAEEIEDEHKSLLVLLVGAKKDMIDNYVRVMRQAKLEPIDIQVSPLSLMRLIDKEESNKVLAIVDIAYGLSNIVISEKGVPKLARMVQSSILNAAQVSACTAEELVSGTKEFMPDAMLAWSEILAGEIHTSMGYYLAQKGAQDVDKIILSGLGASFDGLAENLMQMLSIPVELIKPFKGISVDSKVKSEISYKSLDFALSTSLALRGMEV
ncbi:MAG: hypothetical protein APF76_08070 [Desulfitibacter sp. BRH_c19]|nr:MAG: hypothetical protein APF76_08070 [Desulfitibacter sp. BRH_c19]